jgi:hypothetical protein
MLIAKACLEKGVEPYFFVASELWQRKGLAQNAFTYYYAHRRLSKAQMEKVDADVMQNRCVIIKNRYSVNRYWHGDTHQDTSSIWDWFNASGPTSDHGSEKTILEKK